MNRFTACQFLCLVTLSLSLAAGRSLSGQLHFTDAGVSAEEGRDAVLKVSRSGSSARPAAVRWSTSAGTAASGADFAAASGTLNFGAGVRTLEVRVALKRDTRIEKPEFFFVWLSRSGAGPLPGWPFIARVTIEDVTEQCAGDISVQFPAVATGPARGAFEQPDGRIVAMFEDWEFGRHLRRYWPNGTEDRGFEPDAADAFYPRGLLGLRDGGFILETDGGSYRYSDEGHIQASWQGGRCVAEKPDGTLLCTEGTSLVHRSRAGVELARYSGPWGEAIPAQVSFSEISVAGDGSINGVRWELNGRGGLLRLKPNGEVDDTFRPAITWPPHGHLLLPDGSLLVASNMVDVTTRQPLPALVKLRPDGSVDSDFHYPAEWHDFRIERMSLAPDGRVLLAQQHSEFWTLLRRIAPDGTPDPDFAAALEKPGDDTPWSSLEAGPWTQKNGSIFISGSISGVNGETPNLEGISYAAVTLSLHGRSVRCPGFVAPVVRPLFVAENAGASPVTLRRVRGSHGTLTVPLRLLPVTAVAGEDFPAAWTQTVVFGPGETEKQFHLPTLDDALFEPSESAFLEVVESGGQRLLDRAGPLPEPYPQTWDRYYGTGYDVRIVDDESQGAPGTPDLTFHPDLPNRDYLSALLPRTSGKILTLSSTLRQILPDGRMDPDFVPDLSGLTGRPWQMELDAAGTLHVFTNAAEVIALEENGQRRSTFGENGCVQLQLPAGAYINSSALAAGGGFYATVNVPPWPGSAISYMKVLRFDARGAPSSSQPIHVNSSRGAEFLLELPDGSFLVRHWYAVGRSRIERCRADATADPGFQPIIPPDGWPVRVMALASGKIMIAHQFLRRYHSDGTPDLAWLEQSIINPEFAHGARVYTFFEDAQGRIVVGGSLNPVLRRYLPDGTLDTAFAVVSGRPLYNGVQLQPARDGSNYYYGTNLDALNELPLPPVFRVFGQ